MSDLLRSPSRTHGPTLPSCLLSPLPWEKPGLEGLLRDVPNVSEEVLPSTSIEFFSAGQAHTSVKVGKIRSFIMNKSKLNSFKCRRVEHLEWLQRRKGLNLSVGAAIDFQDHQGKWSLGYITQVKEIASITIIDVASDRTTTAELDCLSFRKSTHRLAPPGFFSQKKPSSQE